MMDLRAKTDSESTRIQNMKNLTILPLPPSPSPSLSLSRSELQYTHHHLEQLEASNLLPPELFTSIQTHDDDVNAFLSELENITARRRRVHISVIMNQVTRAGNTMLHLAAIFGNQQILELIAHHFPHLITKKNVKGDTVLHVAARTRNAELIKSVMKCYARNFASTEVVSEEEEEEEEEGGGAIVLPWRMKNKHGNTALHEAVMAWNVEGVEVLFRADGSVTHCMNKEGKSALYLSVETGHYEIMRILLQAPFWDRETHQGTSPLHAAIFARSSGERTKCSATQPLVKSWYTNEDTVSSRLGVPASGERINSYAYGERTTTDKEISKEQKSMIISTLEILKELVEKRPELIHLKDQKGNTPLHFAAAMGDVEGVSTIVKASPASALEWNNKGYLPIHVACRKGYVSVVKQLVQQSWFDPMESLNPKGQSILHIAAKRGKDRVVKYILSERKLENLLNQKDKNGNTPVHLASKYLFPKVLLLLIREKRLNINVLNNESMTARDIVMVNRKSPPTIRELLSYAILNSIGAPLSEKGRRLRRLQDKAPQVEWIKDRVSTILLVAILVATVTFAAGFTMPGGFHDYDNKDMKKIGIATLLDKRMFQLFTVCDVIAMYSSTMGSFILLWAQLGDFHLAFSATYIALYLVALALVTMSVAFMAAVHLVVRSLCWLAYSVMIVGIIFIVMFLALYIVLTFPLGTRWFLLRHISNLIFRIIIPFSGSYSKFKKVKASKGSKKDKDRWRAEILV